MSHYSVYVFGADPEGQLAPYDENEEVEEYEVSSRKEIIDEAKTYLERAKETYAEYTKNPKKFFKNNTWAKAKEIKKIGNEIKKKSKWTDEQFYESWFKDNGRKKAPNGGYLSTYNPLSKWDWYEIGGRWDKSLFLKSRNLARSNETTIDEVDWDKTQAPFAMLIDGEWIEKGQMGWFGMTANEMSDKKWEKEVRKKIKSMDPNTKVTVVDCHI